MTEKRFDVGNLKIQDNAPKGRVYLLDTQGGVNALCSLINGLNDKSNRLEKENWQLKTQTKKLEAQLYCPFDSICIQCNNEYLVQKEKYYVSKCKKGHEQCSKVDVKYCDDFELKGDMG